MQALVLFRPVPDLCRRWVPRRPALRRGAPRRPRGDPRRGARSAAPSPDFPSRPTPATRTAACRFARASSPTYAADRATENPQCRRVPINAAAFTETIAGFSPCKISTVPVFVPNALAREIASNAAIVLSEADSLLFAAKRIGTNREGAPRQRNPLDQRDLGLPAFARRVLPTVNRQHSCFQRPGSAAAMLRPVSWEVSFRTPSRR